MATEEILLKYKADITDLQAKVGAIEAQFKKTSAAVTESQKTVQASTTKTASIVQSAFSGIGGLIAGAFAVQQVISFGKESVKAFQEAELNARKLQTAVSVSGGLQGDFENLLRQSKELQKISIFSDDDIQRAQTAALQFGLTADEVEKLIPIVTDFASATGQSLQGALDSVIRGLEGQGRGLKLYGVEVDSAASKAENLASITDQLSAKFKGQAEIVGNTAAGSVAKYENQINDLQEELGEKLQPVMLAVTGTTLAFTEAIVESGKLITAFLKSLAESLGPAFSAAQAAQRAAEDLISNVQKSRSDTARLISDIAETLKGFTSSELQDKFESYGRLLKQAQEQQKALTDAGKKQSQQLNEDIVTYAATRRAIEQVLKVREQDAEAQRKAAALSGAEAAKKAAEEAKKAAEEQVKAQDALRKFTLKSLDDNAKAEAALQKESAAQRITHEKELAKEFDRIDLELLEKQKQNRIDTAEDLTDIEIALSEKRLQIRLNELKSDKEAGQQLLKDIEQRAKDQIEVLEKVKDDPTTKINEEQEAQKKILSIRKQAVNETVFVLDFLKEQGILNEEEYTKAVEALAQKRKLIKADEANFIAETSAKTAKEQIDDIIEVSQKSLEVAGAIADIINGQTQSQIDALQAKEQAQNEQFDREQDRIQEQVDKRIITEAQGEARSAELKKQREASEKKSNEAVTALKRKQAEINKTLAIFDATLNLAKAISVALSAAPPPFNAALAAISAALAGAQLAAIIATPLPKFFKGTKSVERGLNPAGQDTIPAWLHEGERIIPTEKNKKHWEVYEALDENRFDRYVHKHFVVPKLKEQQRIFEKERQSSFAESVGKSVDFAPFIERMYHDNAYLQRKGTKISNSKQVSKELGEVVAQEVVSALIRSGKL